MEIQVEEVFLKRLDKKLWQYRDCEPTRVELAVLDAYKDVGWSGYFTEHFNYEETLIFMMCWPDHKKIGPRVAPSDAHLLFYSASDGFIEGERATNFSRLDLLTNASNFQRSDIPHILQLWKSKPGLKTYFIGRAHHKLRHASELSAIDLTSYYDVIGGKDYFVDYLERRFPANLHKLFSQARELTEEVRARSDLGPGPNLMDSCMSFWNITNAARYPIGKYMSKVGLDRFSEKALSREPRFLAIKVVELAHEIIRARHEHLQFFSPPAAVLDLKLWRDNEMANVEVKAPNDRLAPHQRAQLEQDQREGRSCWVVNVFEA